MQSLCVLSSSDNFANYLTKNGAQFEHFKPIIKFDVPKHRIIISANHIMLNILRRLAPPLILIFQRFHVQLFFGLDLCRTTHQSGNNGGKFEGE